MLNMRKCRGPCQHLWKRSRAIKKSVHQAEDSRRTLTKNTLRHKHSPSIALFERVMSSTNVSTLLFKVALASAVV